MKIPTITAPIATTNIMPADTSLAILASARHSFVIKSVIDSIEVFTISAVKPKTMVKIIIVISTELMLKTNPKTIAQTEKKR